jgi:nicotinate-nucleotide adenylyltransferase
MRLGIFGGSFDPVHDAHAELARSAQRQVALDEVWFTPSAIQPLKSRGPHATDAQRLAMLELATADEPSWHVCRLEIDRGGVSFTVDTLRAIHAQRSGDELFFLLGADALDDVADWREPAEILRLATLLVARRAGGRAPDLSVLEAALRQGAAFNSPQLIDMPAMDTSSSDIRLRLAAGQSIYGLVPPAVADYIGDHQLYR